MSIGIIASQAFSPNKIDDLILWVDASDIATIIESGGNVSQWNDKSSNNNNLTQFTGSRQPLTGVDTINGTNAITFDGVDDFIQNTGFVGGVIIQPDTIFLVWELPVVNAGNMIDGGTGTANNRRIINFNSVSRWGMSAGTILLGTPRAANTPFASSSIFNFASSEGYINGVLDISGDAGTRNFGGITLGSAPFGGSPLNIKIGEVILYDQAISTAERVEVENYLINKWRINITFPFAFSEDFSSDFS